MAVRLDVTLTGLRVRFSGVDLVAASSRGVFLPFGRIVGTRVMTRTRAVASSPRVPCPGFWWSRRYRAGCWGTGGRRQLWSVRGGEHVVVIDLAGRPFHRVVVEVDEPAKARRRIERALQHGRGTRARQPVDHLPTLIAERPGPDRAGDSSQRQSTSRHGLGRPVGARQAPLTDIGAWLRSLVRLPAPAELPSQGTRSPAGERPPLRGPVSEAHRRADAGRSSRRAGPPVGHELPATAPPHPLQIDAGVAARLRLYEYRTRGLPGGDSPTREDQGRHRAPAPPGGGEG